MKKNLPKNNFKKAFSLLELSIVILIISILIVGSMTASVTAVNNAKYKLTRDRINEIYKAIGNYLLTNKALPCPASITSLKASDPNYGIAGNNGTCTNISGVYANASSTIVYGAIPVQTLGLNTDMSEDGFGTKFTYIVAKAFTDPSVTTSDAVGFGRATPTGIISVKESLNGVATWQNNTNDAILVIISHGNNKFGGFNNNSPSQNSPSPDVAEQYNYGTSFTGTSVTLAANFVSSAVNSDVFDDILFYKTRNNMLLDFNALSLVVCRLEVTTDATCNGGSPCTWHNCNNGGSCTWAQAYYNQIVTSSEQCSTGYSSTVLRPTRRCGAFGVWESKHINPCTQ